MKYLAIPVVLFALMAAGCSDLGKGQEFTTLYEGRTLHCVVFKPGKNSQAVSCDFVRWHKEND